MVWTHVCFPRPVGQKLTLIFACICKRPWESNFQIQSSFPGTLTGASGLPCEISLLTRSQCSQIRAKSLCFFLSPLRTLQYHLISHLVMVHELLGWLCELASSLKPKVSAFQPFSRTLSCRFVLPGSHSLSSSVV